VIPGESSGVVMGVLMHVCVAHYLLRCLVRAVRTPQLQCRGLGMKVKVYNDEGKPVVGEKGELVCEAAFPSMPLFFWNDTDGSRYRAAYFDVYPGIWRHGDFAELTEHGGMVILGRSDATLNPGGVRMGTAELYRVLERLPQLSDSVVIGVNDGDTGNVKVVLFVILRDGQVCVLGVVEWGSPACVALLTSFHVRRIFAIPGAH